MGKDAPRLASRAVELTQQLQKEEEVGPPLFLQYSAIQTSAVEQLQARTTALCRLCMLVKSI